MKTIRQRHKARARTEEKRSERRKNKPTAEDVLEAIKARGYTPNPNRIGPRIDDPPLRDAVHETVHAIEARVPEGQWNRDTIDRYVKRMGRANAAVSELTARAVEQVICEKYGLKVYTLSKAILTSCMEAIKFGDPFPDFDDALAKASMLMTSAKVKVLVKRIIDLAR